MNILSLTRGEVVAFVESGFMRPETIKHYDICKALSDGKTQNEIAQEFKLSDSRVIRSIKEKKCPECGRSRPLDRISS